MKNIGIKITALLLLPLLVSCRKELCYNHWEHSMSVKADIHAVYLQDWEQDFGTHWQENWGVYDLNSGYDALRPGLPTGLKVLVYNQDGSYDERNGKADGFLVGMSEGLHSLLLYNNDTEYLLFNDLESTATATATTRTRTRVPYSEIHADEITVNAPDMLYGHFVENHVGERKIEPDILDVTMKPLVYTYYISCTFSYGAKYIRSARGALSGMSASVYLKDGSTSADEITVLFNEEDCRLFPDGVEATVRSFGIPDFSGGYYSASVKASGGNVLTLDVELQNGNTKSFDIDVSDQLENQPRGGVIFVDNLEITDEEGLELGGGFKVDVDGWGDYEDVEIPVD